MSKRNPVNFSEPSHKSLKKQNMEEGMDNDWDIDDCLVNFGISDDDLDLLLIEVTNGHHPSSAAKKAIEGVDQKGLVNLLTRIFAIAMKNSRSVPKSLIPAAFDLISEILEISSPANSELGETPILTACLKNLDKMSMSGEDWEKLPDILESSYIRWGVTHCVGEILVKWLQVQSDKEEVNKDFGETVRVRGVKNCQVLLGKIGGRIRSDLPGRFLQLQQMARKLLLAEECRDREQLLGIVIMLSALNQREAAGHTEEGTKVEKVRGQVNLEMKEEEKDENLNDSDEEQTGEFFSFAELEKSKQKSEENKAPCKMRLISPSQFEDFIMEDYEKNVDDVNNNKSIECPIDTDAASEYIITTEECEKIPKPEKFDNPFHPKLEVGMAKLDISDANDKPQSPKLIPNNISKIVNDSPTIKEKNDNVPKAPQLLGYLKSLDNKGKKASAHSVTSGCSVGRHPSCRVTLEGPKVSRVHATIFKTVDGIFLQTLSKTNSCCVNGNMIGTDKFIRIVTGDKVEIGGMQFVWMENNGEKVLNKVVKEKSEIKTSQEQIKFKNLNESSMKKDEGDSTNVNAALSGKGDKKIKPMLNVAAILEANLKKMENYAPSDDISSNSVKIPDVTIKLPDMSVPPPSVNKKMGKNSKQATNNAGGQNVFQSMSSVSLIEKAFKHYLPDLTVPPPTFSKEKRKDEVPRFDPKVPPLFTSPEYRSLSGEPLQLKENQPPKYPNVTIPPPIKEIPIKKGKKNNSKNGTPKIERNSGIQFHTQMPHKNMLKSKKSSSALGAKGYMIPSKLDTVVPSVNGTGQLEKTCQDKTDLFKIGISKNMSDSSVNDGDSFPVKKMNDSSVNDGDSFPVKTTKKIQESDDVVIESERFITDD